jgi:hypothetical protein
MYAPKIVVQQVIKLFLDEPQYRDDRYGTIEKIVSDNYMADYGKSICIDFKLMTDIDRAFRYIQQYEPKLRGANWLKRQKQSGQISQSQYDSYYDNEIEKIIRQLKLF